VAIVKDITDYLEGIAPLSLQESYDNSGLLVGSPDMPVKGVTVSLDCTEEVIDDAIKNQCNLVVAHHPILFSGLKRINGKNYVERAIIKAIKNDVALYAIHTNLDNVYEGVNKRICETIGLQNIRILQPMRNTLVKLITFCPLEQANKVRDAMFNAGAGSIGKYDRCSFNIEGEGTFRGNDESKPFVGKQGEEHKEREIRIESIIEKHQLPAVLNAMFSSHPYEEVAYDVYPLANENVLTGSGMIGELSENQDEMLFLKSLKSRMKAGMIRHTALTSKPVRKVAVCGGSGSFLLNQAIKSGADVFVTADFKYHQFFDAERRILIADIGHFESEQYTLDLLKERILEKFSTFAVRLTEVQTNPVLYI